eukprot:CAMPEP_0174913942 /NCGR_PEP_ID=MMETSP0167-20121228/80583_1 /TAXON_ID=38298 /ORGANISM="Rhodella maculata, Strain CCMP736" /LENGTH=197 /DNA_ID=CAMNT_0016158685 /DNA_START=144 /DNA_END=734 /DNA_ORIENTATION=+
MTFANCKKSGKITTHVAPGSIVEKPSISVSQWSRDPDKCFKVAQECFMEHGRNLKLPIYNGLGGQVLLCGIDVMLEEPRKAKFAAEFTSNAGSFSGGLRLPEVVDHEWSNQKFEELENDRNHWGSFTPLSPRTLSRPFLKQIAPPSCFEAGSELESVIETKSSEHSTARRPVIDASYAGTSPKGMTEDLPSPPPTSW